MLPLSVIESQKTVFLEKKNTQKKTIIIKKHSIFFLLALSLEGDLGEKSLCNLAHFSLFCTEGEVKMYRTYREIQNLEQNFSLNAA